MGVNTFNEMRFIKIDILKDESQYFIQYELIKRLIVADISSRCVAC